MHWNEEDGATMDTYVHMYCVETGKPYEHSYVGSIEVAMASRN